MHETAQPASVTAYRLRTLRGAVAASSPYEIGWGLLGYYLLLVGATDCFLWFASGSLGGYEWQALVVYSLMSYPLWMLIGLKGIAREQIDLMEQSKWHAVDLMPGGSTAVFLGHYLGKTIKTKALYLWYAVFVILALSADSGIAALLAATANLAVGAVNLTLGGIAMRMYAPKGYSGVVGAIFSNITWILSGAVFPLGMLSDTPLFYMLNPFAAAVSTPLALLKGTAPASIDPLQLQLYTLAGGVAWLVIFALVTQRAERSQREKCYQ